MVYQRLFGLLLDVRLDQQLLRLHQFVDFQAGFAGMSANSIQRGEQLSDGLGCGLSGTLQVL